MNVQEIVPNTNGTLVHYFVTSIAFTALSVWIITAFQSRYNFQDGVTFWQRLGWPVFYLLRMFGKDPYAPDSKQDIDPTLIDQGLLRELGQGVYILFNYLPDVVFMYVIIQKNKVMECF